MSQLRITDAEKANWAVAYAMQARTKRLAPALKRAYVPLGETRVPDAQAVREARDCAQDLVITLDAALELLGDPNSAPSGQQQHPSEVDE